MEVLALGHSLTICPDSPQNMQSPLFILHWCSSTESFLSFPSLSAYAGDFFVELELELDDDFDFCGLELLEE